MSNYYSIDGVQMPSPTEISLTPTNLYSENTGRDETGYNHIDLIRSWVRKYSITHEMLTDTEVNQIVSRLNPRGYQFTYAGNTFEAVSGNYSKTKQAVTNSGIRWKLVFDVTEN